MKLKTYNNEYIDLNVETDLDANTLVALPALIDPHVHFRTPGHEYKENWLTGAAAAIAGGITTVMDMPNNSPAPIDEQSLTEKQSLVSRQLRLANIKLRHYLHFGATADNIDEYKKVKNKIGAVKIFMGSSTGDLLVANCEDQEKIFKRCAELDIVVMVHAEDDEMINEEQKKYSNPTIFDHFKIRSSKASAVAVASAIEMAKKYGTKLYICHISTKQEVRLIKQAKKEGINVYAEITPHHLFLTIDDIEKLGTKGQMNPPLRTQEDQQVLWEAINDGTIDTIGTDHAAHTIEEKDKPYGQAPSGVPGIETVLPLLLDAYNKQKISLEKIVKLTRTNTQKIFNLSDNSDWVLVDLNLEKKVNNNELKTKCAWSPFEGILLKGWPVETIIG